MFKKSLLAELIDKAVEDCYSCAEGRAAEDGKYGRRGLMVTAEWSDCSDPEYESVMTICIFQDRILKLSYEDPETRC